MSVGRLKRFACATTGLIGTTTYCLPAFSEATQAHWRFALEVDPSPFLEHGYSVHLAYKPYVAPRMRFTLGAFGHRGFISSGSNAGFERHVDAAESSVAYILFPYHAGGVWAGSYAFLERFTYRRRDTQGMAVNQYLVASLATGFQWLPWDRGPYLTPWAAIGLPLRKRDGATLGSYVYHEPSLVLITALHLGWEFDL